MAAAERGPAADGAERVEVVTGLGVLIVSFVLTYLIGLLLEKTIGFRITREEELEGVDGTEHAETGYDLNPLGSIGRGATFGSSHRTDEDEAANNDQEVTA